MSLPPARGVQRLCEMPAKTTRRSCMHTERGPCCVRCADPVRFLRRFASRHVINITPKEGR